MGIYVIKEFVKFLFKLKRSIAVYLLSNTEGGKQV